MAVTTVFDVSSALLSRAPGGSMSPLKLQKLCFYSFGWFAHQTADSLFDEAFYAMERGPVVGELLSAHAGRRTFSLDQLADQFAAREMAKPEIDPYVDSVIDAVWTCYGGLSPFELVDLTHTEEVWREAWSDRPEDTKRGTLRHDAVIRYFLDREPRSTESLDLPPFTATFVDMDWLSVFDDSGPAVSESFIDEVVSYLSVR